MAWRADVRGPRIYGAAIERLADLVVKPKPRKDTSVEDTPETGNAGSADATSSEPVTTYKT